MKKFVNFFALSCTLFLFASITSCSKCEWKVGDLSEAPTYKKQEFFDFNKQTIKKGFVLRNAESNNGVFGCTFYSSMIDTNKDDGLILSLDKTTDESLILNDSKDPYLASEIKTASSYKYGYFSTIMKPSKVEGTASTFFLYNTNPHDEIDIEFLGKDTTKVQFNFFTNDIGGHEYWYDLGFDAGESFHEYGFYWGENEITWYVDQIPVYRVVGDVPTSASQLYANFWSGNTKDIGITSWMGNINNHVSELPSKSYYKAFYAADSEGNAQVAKPQGKDYDVLPSDDELTTRNITFMSKSSQYKYTENEGKYTITYSDISPSTWKNIAFNVEDISNNRWFGITIKNNSNNDYPAHTRLCVRNDNGNINVTSVWRNGSTEGISILNNNETHLDIAAGEEVNIIVRYYGVSANAFSLMFDSTQGEWEPRDGNLTISNFKAGGVQDCDEERTDDIPEEIFE